MFTHYKGICFRVFNGSFLNFPPFIKYLIKWLGQGKGGRKSPPVKERAPLGMSLNESRWKHRTALTQRNPIVYNFSGTRLSHKEKYTWSFLMFNRRLPLRLKGLDVCLVSEKHQHEIGISGRPPCAECCLRSPSLALLVQRSISREPENLPNPSPVMGRSAEGPLIYVKPSEEQSCLPTGLSPDRWIKQITDQGDGSRSSFLGILSREKSPDSLPGRTILASGPLLYSS